MKRGAWIAWYVFLIALSTFGFIVNGFIYINRDVFRKVNALAPILTIAYLLLFSFAVSKFGKHLRSRGLITE